MVQELRKELETDINDVKRRYEEKLRRVLDYGRGVRNDEDIESFRAGVEDGRDREEVRSWSRENRIYRKEYSADSHHDKPSAVGDNTTPKASTGTGNPTSIILRPRAPCVREEPTASRRVSSHAEPFEEGDTDASGSEYCPSDDGELLPLDGVPSVSNRRTSELLVIAQRDWERMPVAAKCSQCKETGKDCYRGTIPPRSNLRERSSGRRPRVLVEIGEANYGRCRECVKRKRGCVLVGEGGNESPQPTNEPKRSSEIASMNKGMKKVRWASEEPRGYEIRLGSPRASTSKVNGWSEQDVPQWEVLSGSEGTPGSETTADIETDLEDMYL